MFNHTGVKSDPGDLVDLISKLRYSTHINAVDLIFLLVSIYGLIFTFYMLFRLREISYIDI